MQRNIFILLICIFSGIVTTRAQYVCNISGSLPKNTMNSNNKKLKKVYLSTRNVYNQLQTIDSTTVKKGLFTFKRTLDKKEPIMMYQLTGFASGEVELFIEPGDINVTITDASNANLATVSGTVTNELYNEYKQMENATAQALKDSAKADADKYGDVWSNTPEGKQIISEREAVEMLDLNAQKAQFVINHNDSPLSLYLIKRDVLKIFSDRSNEVLFKTVSPALYQHPYYRAVGNIVCSVDQKIGGDVPDIDLPLNNGETTILSNYRGKFVILNFWSKKNRESVDELAVLKRISDKALAQQGKLVIVSFCLDTDKTEWLKVANERKADNWLHASDLMGDASQTVRLLKVTESHKNILLDPEGKAISFSLAGSELEQRVTQILNGDLYYQNAPKESSDFEKRMQEIRESK